MYHSVIGKRLVACVNRRDGTGYTVRQFFDEVYIPLFFGRPRLLQNINNSPFDQAITKQKKPHTTELIQECLQIVHGKVRDLEPDASFFLGGPASGNVETTSGQVTSMRLPVSSDDVYASWLGAALGLTVQGGLTLLIDSDDVLLTTYDGWPMYRQYLDQVPKLKPLQVNAWNGQWVAHATGRNPGAMFDPIRKEDDSALEMQGWVQLLFALSYHFRDSSVRQLLTYVYSLGKSNTTVGFVRLNLPEVRRPVDLYQQLFTVPEGMAHARFEALYNTEKSFYAACQQTEIGLRAIKPRDIFGAEKGIPKTLTGDDAERALAFHTYEVWIIAMLNNKELSDHTEALAAALNEFVRRSERGTMGRTNMVKGLLEKRNRREFIEGLAELLSEDSSMCDVFESAVSDLLSLSTDSVTLYLTLLRFKYAAVQARRKENSK